MTLHHSPLTNCPVHTLQINHAAYNVHYNIRGNTFNIQIQSRISKKSNIPNM